VSSCGVGGSACPRGLGRAFHRTVHGFNAVSVRQHVPANSHVWSRPRSGGHPETFHIAVFSEEARARVLGGNTRADNKILSMFQPDTEVIRKGKASKPTEFGKLVKIQEAENQIVTHFEVFDQRPSDLLTPSIESTKNCWIECRIWWPPTPGSSPPPNEAAAKQLGVKQVAVPSRSTKSEKRKQEQKTPWFKKAQRWRTGCEGRISVLKRRHGLNRSRYKGTQETLGWFWRHGG